MASQHSTESSTSETDASDTTQPSKSLDVERHYDETLWHYTDAAGLIGIVKEAAVRASSFRSLNDREEILYGIGVIREAISQFDFGQIGVSSDTVADVLLGRDSMAIIRNVSVVFCASKAGDSLNQWQHYAGRQGYAIGLRRGLRLKEPKSSAESRSVASENLWWIDVTYRRSEQLLLATRVLKFLMQMFPTSLSGVDDEATPFEPTIAQRLLARCVAGFKHEGFQAEREVRYVHVPSNKALEFRPSSRGIVPYVSLGFDRTPARSKSETSWLRTVRCGPGTVSDQAEDQENVLLLLRSNGYSSATVTASAIPYRF